MSLKEKLELLQGKKDTDSECKTPGQKLRSKGKGRGLGRGQGKGPIGKPYSVLTKEQLKFLDELVDMSIDYVYLNEMNDYQIYFRKHLASYGVKSPFQIKDPEKRKEFFNSLKVGWAQEKAKKG